MDRKITVVVVAGIRSQYIKLCAFQRMLCSIDEKVLLKCNFIYVNAGQHYDHDLARGYIDDLQIRFDHTLRYDSLIPTDILSDMIKQLYRLFMSIKSNGSLDYVVVFGDANTTLAGAIAASKSQVKLIHIESGLRTGDKASSEEGNRVIADHLATIRFVSNRSDFNNLTREGLSENTFFSGDIIYDLVLDVAGHGFSQIHIEENGCLRPYCRDDFVIASMHRTENLQDGVLPNFFKVLNGIAHDVLFLAHPRTQDIIKNISYDRDKITVSNHVNYLDMLAAISGCKYIITDSGAIQREAYYLRKRCLIRQNRAFWQSLVDLGAHRLIGESDAEMQEGVTWAESNINRCVNYPIFSDLGCGQAVEFIVRKIIEIGELGNGNER